MHRVGPMDKVENGFYDPGRRQLVPLDNYTDNSCVGREVLLVDVCEDSELQTFLDYAQVRYY
jgi:hypothetical protein